MFYRSRLYSLYWKTLSLSLLLLLCNYYLPFPCASRRIFSNWIIISITWSIKTVYIKTYVHTKPLIMRHCFYFIVSLIQFLLVQGDDFNSDVFYQRRSTTTAVYKPESFRQIDYEQIRIIQKYYQKQVPCNSSGNLF